MGRTQWAVPVLKSTGAVSICGDYKVTINRAVKVDKYPIANASDLFTQQSGGTVYTTLDMSRAYQQFVLDDESRSLTTFKGDIRVRTSAIWREYVSRYISDDHGAVTAEHTDDCRLPRRPPSHRKNASKSAIVIWLQC